MGLGAEVHDIVKGCGRNRASEKTVGRGEGEGGNGKEGGGRSSQIMVTLKVLARNHAEKEPG